MNRSVHLDRIAMSTDNHSSCADDQTLLVASLQAVHQACQGVTLYGADHPAVAMAARRAATGLERSLADLPSRVLGVSRDAFMTDHGPIEGGSELGELARLLHAREIAAIEFEPGVEAAAIVALASALRVGTGGDELCAAVAADTEGRVRLVPLTFATLRMRGAPTGRTDSTPTWTDLARALMHDQGATVPPEQLAARLVDEACDTVDEQELRPWREQVHEVVGTLQDATPSDRRQVLRRLTRFFAGLSPGLRRALLAIRCDAPERSFALLDALSETMPLGEVLEALESIDAGHVKPTKEAMRLYGKLARIAHRVPGERSRIEQILGQAGQEQLLDPQYEASLRRAIAETLTERRPADFTPDDYVRTLDEATGAGSTDDAATPPLHRIDADALRERAADIAMHVIEIADAASAELGAGPFSLLRNASTSLVRRGRTDLVAAASRAASSDLRGRAHEEERRAADRLLDHLHDVDLIVALLDHCTAGTSLAEDELDLLRRGGAAALAEALRRLGRPLLPEARKALQTLVVSSTPEHLLAAVAAIAGDGDRGHASMLALLETLPPDRAVDFLRPLCDHTSSEIRRLAIRALDESGWIWPLPLMERALFDDDRAVRETAAGRLAAQHDPQSRELLIRCLSGHVETARGRRVPDAIVADTLLSALEAWPDAGAQASLITGRLRWATDRARARLAWTLVRRQWRRCSTAGRSWMLIRWLLSPASLMLVFDVLNRPLWENEP